MRARAIRAKRFPEVCHSCLALKKRRDQKRPLSLLPECFLQYAQEERAAQL